MLKNEADQVSKFQDTKREWEELQPPSVILARLPHTDFSLFNICEYLGQFERTYTNLSRQPLDSIPTTFG